MDYEGVSLQLITIFPQITTIFHTEFSFNMERGRALISLLCGFSVIHRIQRGKVRIIGYYDGSIPPAARVLYGVPVFCQAHHLGDLQEIETLFVQSVKYGQLPSTNSPCCPGVFLFSGGIFLATPPSWEIWTSSLECKSSSQRSFLLSFCVGCGMKDLN